jgi:hypothetical protein
VWAELNDGTLHSADVSLWSLERLNRLFVGRESRCAIETPFTAQRSSVVIRSIVVDKDIIIELELICYC